MGRHAHSAPAWSNALESIPEILRPSEEADLDRGAGLAVPLGRGGYFDPAIHRHDLLTGQSKTRCKNWAGLWL